MKKSYLMIAAAAALLVACSDNDTYKSAVQEEQMEQPLSFSAYADKVTKGENSTALKDFYTEFGVYGWKTVKKIDDPTTTEPKSVFENEPNEYFAQDKNGNTVYDGTDEKPSIEWRFPNSFEAGWYYENIRYWDKMATEYQFFAIAPYESTPTYSVNPGDANIAIASSTDKYDIEGENNLALVADDNNNLIPQTALAYSGFKKDYMIAEKKVVAPKGVVTTQDVQLVFHHILTKLNVKVKKSDNYNGNQILKVNELKITNLTKESNFEFTTGMKTNGWKNKSGVRTIDINTPYALDNGATASPAMTDYPDNYWIETLMFPQVTTCKAAGAQPTNEGLDGIYLYVQYQIGSELFNAYYDLAYVFDQTTAPQTIYYTATDQEVVNGDKTVDDIKDVIPGTDFIFAQGSQYNLTLIIGPEPIHFETSVTAWDDQTVVELPVD